MGRQGGSGKQEKWGASAGAGAWRGTGLGAGKDKDWAVGEGICDRDKGEHWGKSALPLGRM